MLNFFRKLVASDDIGPFATEQYVDERINRIEENDLPQKADLVDGKVPNSQLPDVSKIDIDDEMSSTSKNPVQNKVIKQALDNMPWLGGTGIDSVRQKQTNAAPMAPGAANSAISQSSLAEGASNFAGLKGYRYTNAVGSTITTTLTFDTTPDWAVGDVVSIINDSKYPDAGTIQSISDGTVTFAEPLNVGGTVKADDGWDARCAYVSAKPDKGNVELGHGAHAEGVGSKALNAAAHAEGRETKAFGQYSHAEGRDTTAQYCAHAEGINTTASGEGSHSEGKDTEASGNRSHAEGSGCSAYAVNTHAEGYKSRANYESSHAEGHETTADSKFSHSEGYKTVAGDGTESGGWCSHAEGNATKSLGQNSHSEGRGTKALNEAEHAEGRFNASHKQNATWPNAGNTLHSIGIGTADNNRKNAVEVMQDGKVFIYGLDGYDGTNSTSPGVGDLATVVNEPRFKEWYPGGLVTSESQFTQNLKYDVDGSGNAVLKTFCRISHGTNDNSGKIGIVIVPPYVIDNGVKRKVVGIASIGVPSDYSENKHITAIICPVTVSSIGDFAFDFCTKLTSVEAPGVTSVGYSAFRYCNLLSAVQLPYATTIGAYAFDHCTSLASVSLPSVTTVGEHAFDSCTSLASVSLPSSTTLGGATFYACTSLASISLPSVTVSQGVDFAECTSLASISLPSVTAISGGDFYGCTSLGTVDLGPTPRTSVPTIMANAFSGVPVSCRIFVPEEQYSGIVSSAGWSSLVDSGYRILPSGASKTIDVTWATLKKLRDANGGTGSLVPGMQYRITDYVATTTQNDTQTANHPFDIIVTADSTNKLNENARAVNNSTDSYFSAAGCKLEAWELKYCLDNDTTRFAWADTTNGKGVVYWMKDEFENECPYDFKGIVMKAYGDTDNVFRYTFDSGEASDNEDYSLHGGTSGDNYNSVYGNVIKPYLVADEGQRLNFIVFKGSSCYSNTFGYDCYSNTLDNGCSSNTFGDHFSSNTLGDYCESNSFGYNCSSNTFGDYCSSNTLGDYCSSNTYGVGSSSNTFMSGCSSNTFGDNCSTNMLRGGCSYNALGYNCSSNTFGEGCYSNTIGYNCSFNTFMGGCGSNTLGDYCYSNTFGGDCCSNTFGDYCGHNAFGYNCSSNTFGNRIPEYGAFNTSNSYSSGEHAIYSGSIYKVDVMYGGPFSAYASYSANDCLYYDGKYYKCTTSHRGDWDSSHFQEVQLVGHILVDDGSVLQSYFQYIIFENGVQYTALYCSTSRSGSECYQNVTVASGIKGTASVPKLIPDGNKEQPFKTTYQPAGSSVVSV